MEQMPKETKEMEDLRAKVIKLAHQNPETPVAFGT